MILRGSDIETEAEPENAILYKRMVRRDLHGPDLSLTWVRLEGRHRRLVCHESERVYYIIEGSAAFALGQGEPQPVDAGDVVVIPRGTPYGFEGRITYLVMNGPAFRPGSDIYLE
jgi:mannose-6-phosphate isomerase-like protein (cupin superfamily)